MSNEFSYSYPVILGREHACLLEQLQVDGIGGKAQCWGYDNYGQTEAPTDVRICIFVLMNLCLSETYYSP